MPLARKAVTFVLCQADARGSLKVHWNEPCERLRLPPEPKKWVQNV